MGYPIKLQHFLILLATLISPLVQAQSCAELDGAYVFSQESTPQYLGFFGSQFASESIMNQFGSYGSSFSSTSVRNEFGTYGSQFSSFSANNDFASSPPIIYKNGVALYFLTSNQFRSPGVSLTAIDASCTFFSSFPNFPAGPSLPSPPLVVNAADGESTTELAVSWTPVATATIYNVYISQSLGNFQYIGSTQFTSTVITQLQQGVTYYVAVTSSNTAGESATNTFDTGFLANSPATFTISPSAGSNGSISPDIPQVVDENQIVQFTLTPNAGFEIASVGGTCGGGLNGSTFTTSPVSSDCTVNAKFEEIPATAFTVTPQTTGNGSVSPNSPQTVAEGESISFLLSAATGYQVANVGGTCAGTLVGLSYTVGSVTSDCTVSVLFEEAPSPTFTVTPSVTGNGEIQPSAPQVVSEGQELVFDLSPAAGYTVDEVTGSCGGVLAGTQFTTAAITSSCSVNAVFQAITDDEPTSGLPLWLLIEAMKE